MKSVLWFVALIALVAVSVRGQQVYDQTLAYRALSYAGAAYCFPSAIEAWNCQFCDNISTFSIAATGADATLNTFGYIGYDSEMNAIVVAFRGTIPESAANWLLDLDTATFVDYDTISGSQVHSGFLDAYQSVKTPIYQALQQLINQYPSASFFFTGHSMGAAMANIAAIDLFRNSGNTAPVSLITFGSPRVGNNAYAQYCENQLALSWRITHAADIVPHVPTLWMGFWHVGEEVWYPGGPNSYTVCTGGPAPPGSEDPDGSDSLWFTTSVEDHLYYLGIHISGCAGPT